MNEAIAKADTLIEAMGWIRRFRGKTTVVKLGGSLLVDESAISHVLMDVIFMETVGMRPVIVHGGGPAVSAAMEAAAIKPNFIQGRRVTDDRTLEIVEQALVGDVNIRITELIEKLGGRAMNLSFATTNVLEGERLVLHDESNEPIDLGHVGKVTNVNRQVIEGLTYTEQVPVIPSMCLDSEGQKLNVNADTAAMAVAQTLGAEKLIFVSNVNGVLRDVDDPSSSIPSLTSAEIKQLIAEGKITDGMIPKVEACVDTLGRGVSKIHIVDGSIRHALLLEIYTTAGVGTEIVNERTTATI